MIWLTTNGLRYIVDKCLTTPGLTTGIVPDTCTNGRIIITAVEKLCPEVGVEHELDTIRFANGSTISLIKTRTPLNLLETDKYDLIAINMYEYQHMIDLFRDYEKQPNGDWPMLIKDGDQLAGNDVKEALPCQLDFLQSKLQLEELESGTRVYNFICSNRKSNVRPGVKVFDDLTVITDNALLNDKVLTALFQFCTEHCSICRSQAICSQNHNMGSERI